MMWIKQRNSNLAKLIFIVLQTILLFKLCECRNFAYALTFKQNSTKPRISIESNSIQRHIVEAQIDNDSSRSLKRVFLSNRSVICNDGSQAGFYLRKSSGSKKWVVFLEGGWHCYDTKSCRTRWLKLRHLMTSSQWPETRDVGGILSSVPEDNPYWHNANHVLVPYCSSDSWSGTKTKADTRDGWHFMGSLIIRQVITDLIPLGLGRQSGSELLLVGSSAGGLGVMLNLDRISNFLRKEKKLKVLVRGISDSGWFLDREPYTPGAVAASEAVRQGWKMWEGSLPPACVKQHLSEPWRCYFGHRLYSTLKSPLFVFQWLFDEAQMRADSVGAPVTPQQWNYIHDMGGALRTSLDNVTAVFAPSCIGHAVLTKRDWLHIKIDDISLADALRCWEKQTGRKRNKLKRLSAGRKNERRKTQNDNQSNDEDNSNQKTDLKRHREKKKNHRRSRTTETPQEDNLKFSSSSISSVTAVSADNLTEIDRAAHRKRRLNSTSTGTNRNGNNNNNNGTGGRGNKKRRRQKQNQEQLLLPIQHGRHHQQRHQRNHHSKHHRRQHNNGAVTAAAGSFVNAFISIPEPKRCSLRLLERCSWPQCNHSCPTLTNPLTGEEMRFLELLASFGLDIEAVAAALGVDMQTLNNMDHTELVSLLTQQVS